MLVSPLVQTRGSGTWLPCLVWHGWLLEMSRAAVGPLWAALFYFSGRWVCGPWVHDEGMVDLFYAESVCICCLVVVHTRTQLLQHTLLVMVLVLMSQVRILAVVHWSM